MSKKVDEDTLYNVLNAIKTVIAGTKEAQTAILIILTLMDDWLKDAPQK